MKVGDNSKEQLILSDLSDWILWYMWCGDGFAVGGRTDVKHLHQRFSMLSRTILGAVLLASLLLVVFWVKQNSFIYYWNYSGYWTMAIERMKYMYSNSFSAIGKSLMDSINQDDYNVLLPTLTALPLKQFGYTYPRYVFLNFAMFLLPASLAQGMMAVKLLKNTSIREDKVFVLTVGLALCLPNNYFSGLQGYLDIGYLLPLSIAMYHLVCYDFSEVSVSRNIAISVMLILAWLSRRYVIYFIIGYICAMAILALRELVRKRERSAFKNIITNFLIVGSVSLAILLVFFRGFLFRSLLGNYGVKYSAYNASLACKLELLNDSFGWTVFALIGVSGVLCLLNKKNRWMYLALSIMSVVEATVFWKTQAMGIHHKMILNLPIIMLVLLIVDSWNGSPGTGNSNRRYRELGTRAVVLLSIVLMMGNFAKALIPTVSDEGTGRWFAARYSPMKRGDIEAVNTLVDWLNDATENTEDYIYVAASGGVLNCDILRKSRMPETNDAVPHMYATHDVDLRDGFPADFLKARYVVTTTPIELHLLSGQEVVRYLAAEVQDKDSYIGCHFKLRYSAKLDDGVIAKVYIKSSDFTQDDLRKLRDYFGQLYPDSEDIFIQRIK